MFARRTLPLLALLLSLGAPAAASATAGDDRNPDSVSAAMPAYLQCVPYARQLTGIQIRGDAHRWWDQAEGRYARGRVPAVGAVMAFRPHGNMRLGHVAAVSRIVDARTVLLRHANWSEINGRRGQIEDNVRAVDVSPANDWSEVRVWYDPVQDLGTTHWPVQGFIYNRKPASTPAPSLQLARSGEDHGDDPIGAIIASRLRMRMAAR
jgi:surface antigen